MSLNPALATVLNEWFDSRMNDVHVALPGKFKSYDAAKQTAEVIPVIKRSDLAEDDSRTELELPVIPNVKVHWPRAGDFYIHFPIAAGDYCQLIFNEAAIGFWRANGEVASPGDLERHGLSHPYAYPGGWPDDGALPDAPSSEAVIIVASGKHLRVSTASSATADFVALAQKVDDQLTAIANALSAAVPAVPAGPDAGEPGFLAFKNALSSWPSGSVKASTLKAE